MEIIIRSLITGSLATSNKIFLNLVIFGMWLIPYSLDCVFKVTSDLLQRHQLILWNDFDNVYFDLFTILIVYYGVKYRMSRRVFTLTKREKQSLLIRINQPTRLYLLIWWRLPWRLCFPSSKDSCFPRIKFPFHAFGEMWTTVRSIVTVSASSLFPPIPSRIPVRNCVTHLPSFVGRGGGRRQDVGNFLPYP